MLKRPPADHFDFATLDALNGPRFIVTVDTEEEFDWNGGFSRDNRATSHLAAVPRFQRLCDNNGISPVYLVDYPITEDGGGCEMLARFAQEGRAEIGAQLHPWVNPPYDELLSEHNSFACNLPPEVEQAKLKQLHAAIVRQTGMTPDCYRAGRYGAGSHTHTILKELDIFIDSSVRARFDYSDQSGPDYMGHPVQPYWIERGSLLELPLTTMFGGLMRSAGTPLFGRCFESQAARSLLARSNLLERIALTPEGIPAAKAVQCIDHALNEGLKIINISFHSPSLAVGHTPYVRNAEQLEIFYGWFETIFGYLAKSGVRPTTMAEIKAVALRQMR